MSNRRRGLRGSSMLRRATDASRTRSTSSSFKFAMQALNFFVISEDG